MLKKLRTGGNSGSAALIIVDVCSGESGGGGDIAEGPPVETPTFCVATTVVLWP